MQSAIEAEGCVCRLVLASVVAVPVRFVREDLIGALENLEIDGG